MVWPLVFFLPLPGGEAGSSSPSLSLIFRTPLPIGLVTSNRPCSAAVELWTPNPTGRGRRQMLDLNARTGGLTVCVVEQ